MRYLDVVTKKEFVVDGEVKRHWNKVGVIRISGQGRMYLDMFQQPNTDFFVFEAMKGEEDKASQQEG